MSSALTLGKGAKILDAFLEPTCPFSAKAFGKFESLLALAGRQRLTVRI